MNCILCMISSPVSPDEMDWSKHYPKFFEGKGNASGNKKQVEFLDVGEFVG